MGKTTRIKPGEEQLIEEPGGASPKNRGLKESRKIGSNYYFFKFPPPISSPPYPRNILQQKKCLNVINMRATYLLPEDEEL